MGITSGYYGAVKDSEALLSLYLRLRMMGITGLLRTSERCLDLHRPMQTTSPLLFWVMGRINDYNEAVQSPIVRTLRNV